MNNYKEINRKIDKFIIIKRNLLFGLFGDGEKRLYIGQLHVLEYVKNHDGCTQVELANFLGVSAASIAVSTKRLQKAGLLEKREDEHNLRCKNLFITDDGIKAVVRCREIFDEFDRKVFGAIPEEELDTFCKVLDKMTMNMTGDKENNVSYKEMLRLQQAAKPNFGCIKHD